MESGQAELVGSVEGLGGDVHGSLGTTMSQVEGSSRVSNTVGHQTYQR